MLSSFSGRFSNRLGSRLSLLLCRRFNLSAGLSRGRFRLGSVLSCRFIILFGLGLTTTLWLSWNFKASWSLWLGGSLSSLSSLSCFRVLFRLSLTTTLWLGWSLLG